MNNLKSKILESVKKNNLTMIPRWKFVVYSVTGIVGLVFAFLLAIFVISLILFVLSRYGFMYMPFFGVMATLRALSAIPIVLLLCAVLLLVLIEIISRYYTFSFRRPLAVTLLSITSLAVVVSYIVSETSAHDYLRSYAREHQMHIIERMYERPIPFKSDNGIDIVRGGVIASTPTSTTLELFDGDTVVAYSTTTDDGGKVFIPHIGDDVMVFGTFSGGQFIVVELRPVPKTPFGGRMHHDSHMMNREGIHQNYIRNSQGGMMK